MLLLIMVHKNSIYYIKMASTEQINKALKLPKDTPPKTWWRWVPSSLALTSGTFVPVNGSGQVVVFISQGMVDWYGYHYVISTAYRNWIGLVLQRSLITAFGVSDLTHFGLMDWFDENQGNFGAGIRETIYVTGNTYEVEGNRVFPDAPPITETVPDPNPTVKPGTPVTIEYYEDNVEILHFDDESQISKGVGLRGYRVEKQNNNKDYIDMHVIFEAGVNSIDTNAKDTQGSGDWGYNRTYVQTSLATADPPLPAEYQVLLQPHECSVEGVRVFKYGNNNLKFKVGVYFPPDAVPESVFVDFVCVSQGTIFCHGTLITK
jgi:hypothetical protein